MPFEAVAGLRISEPVTTNWSSCRVSGVVAAVAAGEVVAVWWVMMTATGFALTLPLPVTIGQVGSTVAAIAAPAKASPASVTSMFFILLLV